MFEIVKSHKLLFLFTILVATLLQFDTISLLPDNVTTMLDDSPDTCSQFNINPDSPVPKFTIFRFELPEYRMDYINVTLIGNDLGCGYNLYISPLAEVETEKWTGRWKICHLEETSVDMGRENCTYHCKCLKGCEEFQVLKRPTTVQESSWILCDVVVDIGGFPYLPLHLRGN